ncbi:MAG: DUF393 domain-containing protein [Actinobacteria bacterium]|nr:DUF393 domain-containing protein [Actinomycetota bacterium]
MLIFDGDCGFCTTSARWVERRLPGGMEVVPFQGIDDLAALGLTLRNVETAAYWVDGHKLRRGHRAVAAALRHTGPGWWVVGVVIDVPPVRWLAAGVYRLVARYRYRLPGATSACRVDNQPEGNA